MTRPATDNPAYQKVYLRLHAARPGASQETLHRLTEQFFRGLAARSAATSPAPAASPASPTVTPDPLRASGKEMTAAPDQIDWEAQGRAASPTAPAPQYPEELRGTGGDNARHRQAFARGWTVAYRARRPGVNLYVDEAGTLVHAQGSERPRTARVRTSGGWKVHTPRGALRMATVDEIAEAGHLSGRCEVCGRELSGDSARVGIGAKCRAKLA